MRQRHIKNRESIIEECGGCLIEDPAGCRERWNEVFGRTAPVVLEIGSGKGQFVTGMAQRFPDIDFIACEGQFNVYPRILQKVTQLGLTNVKVIGSYISDPSEFFSQGEISGIYLNFSDPWKKRTRHRRLTSRQKLEGYRTICAPGSFLRFKTDNDELFEYSLEELAAAGLVPSCVEYDLHNSPLSAGNIMTEYEEKFTNEGSKIKYFCTYFT